MDDSAFVNGYNIRVEEDYDNNFFRDAWYQDQWTFIGGDDNGPEPPMNDSQYIIHGLKPMVASYFDTIL